MTLPSCIFLVGMPGSGKSTVGSALAEEISFAFIDLDHQIEKKAGKQIREIFQSDGEEYFRLLEKNELREIGLNRVIVATGGGTPCFHDNMNWMNEKGLTVFIDTPLDVLIRRTKGKIHRPLLKGNEAEVLSDLQKKRLSFYQRAHVRISSEDSDQVEDQLIQWLRSNT